MHLVGYVSREPKFTSTKAGKTRVVIHVLTHETHAARRRTIGHQISVDKPALIEYVREFVKAG